MKKSDLLKLKRDVLNRRPEEALPQHLSDVWLTMLLRDLENILHEESEDHTYMKAPLALIVHILMGKHGNTKQEITFTERKLFGYLHDLRLEISFELIRRNTRFVPEPATLETIFTNRSVISDN